ncbi:MULTISPECIES: alpha/beta hydrolase [Hyphococcus]|jgi:pimeloyl-ACP methyl ester carboxylesterase|uniref:Alpha/beta hydrolase n=1 Tax=Hyphococcus luteus TaxID=2058213 RepID=A0A2S7K186_9PROT|nr:alpha/beta hydrolase [Marinicaulis flavus]PQA86277.1 alpha/beta hydrolase [Marinicaulis flavus]
MTPYQQGGEPETIAITSFDGCALVASQFGRPDKGAIILSPGGGQTRHAWSGAAFAFAREGYIVLCADLRGHGDSDRAPGGTYSYTDYARDALVLSDWMGRRTGVKPHFIGASLGGVAALVAAGKIRQDGFASLTLVDVAPKISEHGFCSIRNFMLGAAKNGFENVSEAAAFLSKHFPRPNTENRSSGGTSGLQKNLRQGEDGRWRWHWDPAFVETLHLEPAEFERELTDAAKSLIIPVHFMRAGNSELVTQEAAAHFRDIAPHIHFTEIKGAQHMLTGDQNDIFVDAALDYLARPEFRRTPGGN